MVSEVKYKGGTKEDVWRIKGGHWGLRGRHVGRRNG